MGAHAEHTDHESTASKVTAAPTAAKRAPSGGASTASRGIVRPGLEEAIARASSTRGPMTAGPQGRIQRSALASPAASVGHDPSGAIQREKPPVNIEQANAEREKTRIRLAAEANTMEMHFEALISVLPQLQLLSVPAITQPAALGPFYGLLPVALDHIEQLARDLDRVTKLLDARRREIISPEGKIHLDMLDKQLDLFTIDLNVWRGLVMAPPQSGSGLMLVVLNSASYYKGTIPSFIYPLFVQNEDEIKGIPTAPPPPPPMTGQQIAEEVEKPEFMERMKILEEEGRGLEIMDEMKQQGIIEPPGDFDPRAVAKKENVLQELKQRDN